MQDDSGLNKVLTISWIYDLFQTLVGNKKAKKWLSAHYWKCEPGSKVVDLGCGPGKTIEYFGDDIQYIGIDISQQYITAAKKKYGTRGKFFVGVASDFLNKSDHELMNADIVLCNGILHHLDDEESIQLLMLAKKIMKPGARFISCEAVFLEHQDTISNYIASKDRGGNVRKESEWKILLAKVFPEFTTDILSGLLLIPYIHIVMVCKKAD